MSPGQELPPSYNLGSLLLLTTLVSVVLGVTLHAPGWGVVLMFFAVPAFIRTALIVGRFQRRGITLSLGRKAGLYLDSVGIMFAYGVMTTLTFWATGYIGYIMGMAGVTVLTLLGVDSGYVHLFVLLLSLLVSITASLVVLVKMARVTWPYRDE